MSLTTILRRALSATVLVPVMVSFVLPFRALETVRADTAVLSGYLHPSVELIAGRVQSVKKNEKAAFAMAYGALIRPLIPVTKTGRSYRTIASGTRFASVTGSRFSILATAYSSTPDQTSGDPFITASGTRVHDGTIATNLLPFGTKVRLPGYAGDKIFIVEDRHHPRLSPRVDIWMETRQEAIIFGARVVELEIVE